MALTSFPRCQFCPQDFQRLCSAPLDGTPGQAQRLAGFAVCLIQNQVQNQNALLLFRQTGKGVGNLFAADWHVIAAIPPDGGRAFFDNGTLNFSQRNIHIAATS